MRQKQERIIYHCVCSPQAKERYPAYIRGQEISRMSHLHKSMKVKRVQSLHPTLLHHLFFWHSLSGIEEQSKDGCWVGKSQECVSFRQLIPHFMMMYGLKSLQVRYKYRWCIEEVWYACNYTVNEHNVVFFQSINSVCWRNNLSIWRWSVFNCSGCCVLKLPDVASVPITLMKPP